jgi:hypothetical protein
MKNGGKVHFQNYLSMPHVFVIFEKHPSTERCYRELGKFTKAVTSGKDIETSMEVVNGKGEIEGPLNIGNFPITFSKYEVISPLTNLTDRSSFRECKR